MLYVSAREQTLCYALYWNEICSRCRAINMVPGDLGIGTGLRLRSKFVVKPQRGRGNGNQDDPHW
jgi:hypothetical protein